MKNYCLSALSLCCLIISLCTCAQTVPDKVGTLSDMSLLEGHWMGTFNGGPIEAVWSAPAGDNIVGFIRMMKNEKVTLYELFAFEQTERGPVAMVKHFKPGLIGQEEREKSDRYIFVEAGKNRALFEKDDTSIRIIYERRPNDQLVIRRGQKKDADWVFTDLFVFTRVR
ncbi:DUF6265 family protein [Spirosoma arcticum]